jgi:aryl-alcohol dehydrogenase (NADP+)
MQFETLGKTGIRVSRFCLGAMMFGAWGNRDHGDCERIIHRALDAGINFIDTADVYSNGESEKIVGKALAGGRDDVVVATKFFAPMGSDPNRRGGSRRWIVQAVEDSLRRLRLDAIDLYQMHRFDEDTDLEESMSALTDLVQQGKIRAFGSSMFPADRIVESHGVAERRGLQRFRCEQAWYSIFAREIERTVLPVCERYGMGMIVWSPLDGGLLTGRYRCAEDFSEDSRLVRLARGRGGFDAESEPLRRKLALIDPLVKLADEVGVPLARLAVAFTLAHPAVTSAILGPRTGEQLEDLLAGADLQLDADVLDRIDELVRPGTSIEPIDPTSTPRGLRRDRRRRV